jgi:hypothetical protein
MIRGNEKDICGRVLRCNLSLINVTMGKGCAAEPRLELGGNTCELFGLWSVCGAIICLGDSR